ncbi:tail tube protein [Microcystis phage vB_MaeS-yong1]|nr:tail tube protein [Microcystis phage vB_MaeS-yong1]
MKFRKKVLLLALQSAVGTPATPTGALNAVLTKNLTIMPMEGEALSRELDKEDFGADLATIVGRHVKVTFQVEVAGSGTPGEPPAWGPAFVACGHLQFIDSPGDLIEVRYTPIDTALPATLIVKHDTSLHTITDARGSVRLVTGKRRYAMFEFEFIGIYQTPVHSTTPLNPVTTAYVKPVPFRAATTEFTLFGETLCLNELTLNGGQQNGFYECSEQETIQLENRQATFEAKVVEPALNVFNIYEEIEADTAGELSYTHGTVAGNIVQWVAHHAQITNPPQREDDQGNMVLSLSGTQARVGTQEYTVTVR